MPQLNNRSNFRRIERPRSVKENGNVIGGGLKPVAEKKALKAVYDSAGTGLGRLPDGRLPQGLGARHTFRQARQQVFADSHGR